MSLSLEVGHSCGCYLGSSSVRLVSAAFSCPFATASGPELWPANGPIDLARFTRQRRARPPLRRRSTGHASAQYVDGDIGDDAAMVTNPVNGPRESLTLSEAYRAAFHLVDQYIALEREPDEGLVLLWAYLTTDPARWNDWLNVRPACGPS